MDPLTKWMVGGLVLLLVSGCSSSTTTRGLSEAGTSGDGADAPAVGGQNSAGRSSSEAGRDGQSGATDSGGSIGQGGIATGGVFNGGAAGRGGSANGGAAGRGGSANGGAGNGGATDRGGTANAGAPDNQGGDIPQGGSDMPAGAPATGGSAAGEAGSPVGAGGSAGSGNGGATTGGCEPGTQRPCSEDGFLGTCADGAEWCSESRTWSDCDIQPTTADTCEAGNDDNCNGDPNEGCPCLDGDTQDCGETDVGLCQLGTATCVDGQWDDCVGAILPQPRNCTSPSDNNCDGSADNTIDDVCQCAQGQRRTCGSHPEDGTGPCHAGSETCQIAPDSTSSTWPGCSDSVGPTAEQCDNQQDDDCDGATDGRDSDCCPQGGGVAMVWQPGNYCIDSVEVTRARYEAWLATSPSISTQPSYCLSTNETYLPDESCMAGEAVFNDVSYGNHPQVCIGWCDANAYCQAMGKSLCGAVGGGYCDMDLLGNTEKEWYMACSAQGTRTYPYGNTFQAAICNVSESWGENPRMTTPVQTRPDCQVNGIYDMVGNLREYTACCADDDQYALCETWGSTFDSLDEGVGCPQGVSWPFRHLPGDAITGFRCCS